MIIKNINLDKIMRDTEKRREKEIEYLESQTKKLCDLIVAENFIVEDVISESYATPLSLLIQK